MSAKALRTWPLLAAFCVLSVSIATIYLISFFLNPIASKPDSLQKVDLKTVVPGGESLLSVAGQPMRVSVPAGEGRSVGTFSLDVEEEGRSLGPFDRDGSLESAFIADLAGDDKVDILFVMRSAGSGSYVDLLLLTATDQGYQARTLPGLPSQLAKGYMGHDVVDVMNGAITRSFPTYEDSSALRIDKNYEIRDALDGKSPIKSRPDSNADPSGGRKIFTYNPVSGTWK